MGPYLLEHHNETRETSQTSIMFSSFRWFRKLFISQDAGATPYYCYSVEAYLYGEVPRKWGERHVPVL